MVDYCDIADFGEDGFKVHLVTVKQRKFFYKKVLEYSNILGSSNYIIDIENDLWRTHKSGVKRNPAIMQRLVLHK